MNKNIHQDKLNKNANQNLNLFYSAVLQLKNADECHAFFGDICTVQELKAISQRLKVAKLLAEKQVYNQIVEKTGASTATISRVNRALNLGNDGYSLVLERLSQSFGGAENE